LWRSVTSPADYVANISGIVTEGTGPHVGTFGGHEWNSTIFDHASPTPDQLFDDLDRGPCGTSTSPAPFGAVTPQPNIFGVNEGDTELFRIKDGGEPSAGPVDDFLVAHDIFPAVSCKQLFYVLDLDNVTQGNINIKNS
jgi:hypothetical protein